MVSLTIRKIPEKLLSRLRMLAASERRSINSEILILLEEGCAQKVRVNTTDQEDRLRPSISVRLQMWNQVSGMWKDSVPVASRIMEIYEARLPSGEEQ
jgi:hypothetical protein